LLPIAVLSAAKFGSAVRIESNDRERRSRGWCIVAEEQRESGKVLHYKDLQIWQKGMRLTKVIYQLTRGFPTEERYGLASQMRRAAVSIPSNIAEGQARRGTKEFVQFLSVASGSLAELDTQLLLSMDLGYTQRTDATAAATEITEIQKMIAAIQRKLAARMAVMSGE
jgi:four helix bundle protein